MSKLRANLSSISREPVIPEKWSKKKNPVTRSDLGNDFRALVQCNADPRSLALYFDHAGLGDVIKPSTEVLQTGKMVLGVLELKGKAQVDEGWKNNILELKRRGVYILNIWGYLPYTSQLPGKNDMPEPRVPLDTHKWLLKKAGRLLSGYDVGEQDGRYLGNYAKKFRPRRKGESYYDYYCWQHAAFGEKEHSFKKHLMKNYFRSRKDAYRDFRKWMVHFEKGLHHYLTPVAHTNYLHYLCELNETRIIGAELALILSNHQVCFAFMRGASRQYGLLFWTIPSVWSRWGFSYPAGKGQTHIGTTEIGLYKGTPVHLARRIWYLAYMYGTSMLGMEAGYFKEQEGEYLSGKTDKPPALSELGKLQVEGTAWCKRHPDRGVQYNPVAVMLDFYNGWLPPKHGYQYMGEKRLVWGALPYERGDHQIDNFFRWVFPGYEEGSYHRDGKGTFVATPYGDIFDVLLSNADPRVLKRYNAIILLGEDIKVTDVLKKYVRDGGDLIVGVNNMKARDEKFYGVKQTGRILRGKESRCGEKMFDEGKYHYHELTLTGAEALLTSAAGHPLVTAHGYGKGRVIVLATDYWMTEIRSSGDKKVGLASQKAVDRNPENVFKGRTEFFDERNWDCPYNCAVKKIILEGGTLGRIEKEVCVYCRVECTNEVVQQCDILEGVKAVFGDYLGTFMPFKIQGPPVHYLMNVGEDPKRVVVTLVNHEKVPWEGSVCFNDSDRQAVKIREWIEDVDGDLAKIMIRPEGIKIFEITADRNIFSPSH